MSLAHRSQNASADEGDMKRIAGQATEKGRSTVRQKDSKVRMNGADAILRSLEAEGVEVMFGIPGGAIMPTYDAMARGTTVRHVLARHEQGAGHMAQGYARASGRVGVAIATSGPGATNLVTPIADAWMDSTPLVCITGQVRSTMIGTDAFQECDITGITMPVVKHSWLVQDVREIPAVIKAAFHVARTGRCGPVLVDVPRDIQEAELDFHYPETVDLPGWRPPRKVHPLQIREAGRRIAEAEKPVLYVGGGTINGEACDELLELAETGGLPVITTLMGKGAFPETHPLHFGWPGMHGPKWSNLAMNTCDVLVAIGARFDDRVTGKLAAFAPGATVVHLDIDPAEISKLREADVPVVGPLKNALAALATEVDKHRAAGTPAPEAWVHKIEEWRDEFPLRYGTDSEWLKPQKLMETLQELTAGEDVIFTTGVGQHQMWAMQYLLCERPRTFITSGGLGTMGYGIPAAIGAKAARPEAKVVCVDGDGCFQMTAQELTTAVIDDLPIVVVLVNNGYLGMVTQWQDMFFDGRRSHVGLGANLPDYVKLAEAYGGVGMLVESEAELEPALREALSLDRTVVIDCRVEPAEQCFPMIPAGAAAIDMVEYEDQVEAAP
jgi:acetolactate synthase I/II/III large subunit